MRKFKPASTMNNTFTTSAISFITLAFTLISYYSEAQSTIKSFVYSEGKPVPFVFVTLQPGNHSATSGQDGQWRMDNLDEGHYKIELRCLGFAPLTDSLTVPAGSTIERNFYLQPAHQYLREVEIVDEQTGLQNWSPYSMETIRADAIERKGSPSGLMGQLTEAPGITGAEMGHGIVKPIIRGLGFSRVVTIYQGNKLENHPWGADHGLGVNDLGVRSTEVIKGPASILYGSGAIGGVIMVRDDERYLESTQLTGQAGATFNSVSGGYRPYASLGKSFSNGFFIAADGAIENHADYVDGNNRVIGNSRFRSETGRIHLGLKKKNFRNKLSYTYHNQQLGIIEDDEMDDDESLATTRFDRAMQLPFQKVQDHILSYSQSTVHNRWTTTLHLSYHINDREEIEDEFDEVDLGLFQTHLFYNARVAHRTSSNLENTLGVQGSHLHNRNKEDAEEILIPDARHDEIGIYYLGNLQLGKTLLQGGLRYDYREVRADATAPHIVEYGYELPGSPADAKLSRLFSGWTGSLGLHQAVGEFQAIKLNLSTGFRSPDLAELFSNGPHPGTNRFEVGDASFNREQSLQADVAWNVSKGPLTAQLTVFGNYVDQFLYFAGTGESAPNDGDLEIWAFLQTDAFLYGGEFQLSYRPMQNNRLEILAQGSLVRGLDLENDRPLTFIPADRALLRVSTMPFVEKQLQFSGTLRMVGEQNLPGLGEERTAGYALVDVAVSHRFDLGTSSIHVGLQALNLLNQTYVDHVSILRAFNVTHPGRNLMINLQYQF